MRHPFSIFVHVETSVPLSSLAGMLTLIQRPCTPSSGRKGAQLTLELALLRIRSKVWRCAPPLPAPPRLP